MITRRHALISTMIASLFPSALIHAQERRIPQRPSVRMIADNDYAGDPDGLFALAHHLLTPKAQTKLITVCALDDRTHKRPSINDGVAAALELIRQLGIKGPPVVAGTASLYSNETGAAAEAIIAEAMREDPMPLVITCGGPLTNLAAALRQEPQIAKRLKLYWIGGGEHPHGSWEYNLMADLEAVRTVFAQPELEITQIPQATYRQMLFSVAELYARMRPISPVTRWLYDRFTSPPAFVNLGGTWPMGDTPTVLLAAIGDESSRFETVPACQIADDGTYGEPIPGRTIRLCTHVDARLGLEDCLALFAMHRDNELPHLDRL